MRQPDVLAEFERVFTEAGLPLSRSAATRPRPRLKLAAPVPMGIELRGEVLEVWFDELVPMEEIQTAAALLPDGLTLVDAREVWQGFPSAASQVRAAEYEVVVVQPNLSEDRLRGAIVQLLAAPELLGRRRRGETERRSDAGTRDLRPYIEDVELLEIDNGAGTARLRMVLRLDPSGTGRPEDVVDALGLGLRARGVVRTRLVFVDTPPIAR